MKKNCPRLDYFRSDAIQDIRAMFNRRMNEEKIDKDDTSVRKIRECMFEFFQTTQFKNAYFSLAAEIIHYLGFPIQSAVLQMLPTPRIFRPGSIGTSYHCDYWYGHGVMSNTVWVPLSEVEEGNTFWVIDSEDEEALYKRMETAGTYDQIPSDLTEYAVPVMPDMAEAFVFSSKLIHGSPVNKTNQTRLSFDFRLSPANDPTSTKDLANYFHYRNETFELPKHDLDGKRVLKYICGGKGKNTYIQHIIIEETARRYNINASEQEAEIERFGHPIFKSYLQDKKTPQKLDGLIIASKNILSEDAIKAARMSKMRVWCALENDYLNNL